MNTNTANLEQLSELKLAGMARLYQSISQLPVNQHPDGHTLLGQLLQAESQSRKQKRTELFLRLSKLRYHALIEQISYSQERNLTKETISQLSDCSYIDRSENILVTGATGCGKSFISCALGHQACLMGYRTLYFNMNRFIESITMAKLDGSFIKLLNKIRKAPLLILDDFGLQPMEHQVKLALLQILEDRYGQSSTVISAQLPVAEWYNAINEPTVADAILDRLTAKAHRIELKGKSMRHSKGKC